MVFVQRKHNEYAGKIETIRRAFATPPCCLNTDSCGYRVPERCTSLELEARAGPAGEGPCPVEARRGSESTEPEGTKGTLDGAYRGALTAIQRERLLHVTGKDSTNMGEPSAEGVDALAAALSSTSEVKLGSLTQQSEPATVSDFISSAICHRMGCGEKYDPNNNPSGCCRYHPAPPYFHDGIKEWTCCKKKSHDFVEFTAFPGCTTGKHSSEKPQRPKAPEPVVLPAQTRTAKPACPRCAQGFFCSDHQETPQLVASSTKSAAAPLPQVPSVLIQPAVVVKPLPVPDTEGFLTCRHFGCGNKYKEDDNGDEACLHHPGPAVFHDRKKGWGCCEKFENDFDAFMQIPPCTTGRHDASFEGTLR